MKCKHNKSLLASQLLAPILNGNALMLHANKDDLFYMHLKSCFKFMFNAKLLKNNKICIKLLVQDNQAAFLTFSIGILQYHEQD